MLNKRTFIILVFNLGKKIVLGHKNKYVIFGNKGKIKTTEISAFLILGLNLLFM